MTETKFTPGPWTCHRNSSFWEFGSNSEGQLGDVCASMFDGDGERPDAEKVMEANAHLIAAAPDLYDALSDLVSSLDCSEKDGFIIRQEIKVARAALAKARGES